MGAHGCGCGVDHREIMNNGYIVRLIEEERSGLERLVSRGRTVAWKRTHAPGVAH